MLSFDFGFFAGFWLGCTQNMGVNTVVFFVSSCLSLWLNRPMVAVYAAVAFLLPFMLFVDVPFFLGLALPTAGYAFLFQWLLAKIWRGLSPGAGDGEGRKHS